MLLPAQGVEYVRANYTKFEFQIPMRDGVKLFTSVYVPKDQSKPYPFLMQRTPYSVAPYGIDNYRGNLGPSEQLARSAYIFVYQDVRGRYQSEGSWVEMTPHKAIKRSARDTDESSDTYDTVDWLLKNVPNSNGRAGVWGISYPGFYAAAALVDAHPALKAISPQAPIVDLFRGDDAFHNGAFMLAANFGFYNFFKEHKGQTKPERSGTFEYGTPDAYQFYLDLGPLGNSDEKFFRYENKYWTANLQHVKFDEFWRTRNLEPHLKNIKPAVLVVGGWFDAEDLQGPLRVYAAASRSNAGQPVTLVMGPWSHGGWSRGDGSNLGPVTFGVKTGPFFRESIEAAFFEQHLKNAPAKPWPAAWVFETGRNEWHRYEQWPPAEARQRALYLSDRSRLSWDVPQDADAFDEYVSDPAKPVPFLGFVAPGVPREYMVADQRFAAARPDVLTYETDVLQQDLTVAGPLRVKLNVSSSGTDSDWVVKLIDVYPGDFPDPDPNPTQVRMGGYQQLVRGEPYRARFRESLESPMALPPGEFVTLDYALPDIFHTFQRGHRIMVQIQSSWFPLVDRNPQTFVESIPFAKPADFRKATQRVSRSRARPTFIELPVLPSLQ